MASKEKPSGLSKSDSQAPGLNIKSYVRVRPLQTGEKRSPNLEISRREETISIKTPDHKFSKVFTFDRVFVEDTRQMVLYATVVKPMVSEVIQGYNCTVFAYGQTGTGKTFTMTGCLEEDSVDAGIIPRAMDDIFNELSAKSYEYQVSIVFLELYNEKLRNLLSDIDDQTEIKIVEDAEGSVFIKGVLPTVVKNKDEAIKLLQKGSERKRMAATLLNVNSSRSHTILTINVNIKESALDKDDILRVGKLHLVDLAGSENLTKSGTIQEIRKEHREEGLQGKPRRLTETVNINTSLLTLGRVITAITEKHSHIPYRESKLTRILKDSLGGKTKTRIIGTIAPSHITLDETENTISYVSKARRIKNNPVKNQTISKKGFMQVASNEILQLQRDLDAVRQGEGFYISHETHEEMKKNIQSLDVQVRQWNERYNIIDTKYEQLKEQFMSMSEDFEQKSSECDEFDRRFRLEQENVQRAFEEKKKEIVVREYLIDQYKKTEKNLTDQAKQCKSVLENILDENKKLHGKIDAQKENETVNTGVLEDLKKDIGDKLDKLEKVFKRMMKQEEQFSKNINHSAEILCDSVNSSFGEIKSLIQEFQKEMSDKYVETLVTAEHMQRKLDSNVEGAVELEKEILLLFINMLNNIFNLFENRIHTLTRKVDTAITNSCKVQQHLNHALIELKLEDNLESLQKKLKSISDDILDLLSWFESKMNQAVEHSNQSKMSFENMNKKMTQICEDVKELQIGIKGSCDRAEESHKNVESLKFNFRLSKNCIKKCVQEQNCATESVVKTVCEKLSVIAKPDAEHQQETELEDIKDHIIDLNQGFGRATKDFLKCLETEMKNCEHRLKCSLQPDSLIHIFKINSRLLYYHTSCYWFKNNEKINDLEEHLEEKFRDIQREVRTNLELSNESHSKGLRRVRVVKDIIYDLKYKPTIKQGSTPTKCMSEELKIPKEFDATAPMETLLEGFNQMELQRILLQEESTSEDSIKTLTVRRSLSCPDLMTDDKAIENKENMGSQDLIISTTKKHTMSPPKRSPLKTSNTQRILRENNTGLT